MTDVIVAIQLAAASEAGVGHLTYHSSDRELCQLISSTARLWTDRHWTVGRLVTELLNYAAAENCDQRFLTYSTDTL